MNKNKLYNILNIVTISIVAMFFSCKDNFNEVKKIGVSENEPIGIDYNINLKYTDSGKVKANLLSKKHLDFSNRDFPYHQCVDGVTLYIYDKNNQKSTIISDNAYIYKNTDLIDMQDNVVITTYDNRVLKTEQLFYDQKKDWVSTNKPVSFKTKDDLIYGNGFDSNTDFSNAEVLEVTGDILIEE